MSYIYKTILRKENHVFTLMQDRWNSAIARVFASPRHSPINEIFVCSQNNKTGKIMWNEYLPFAGETIKELEKRLQLS